MPASKITIGLIADTHGLLRPEALDALTGSDAIVHAGDIGHPGILAELARLAPVTAIRGNIDTAAWARSLPAVKTLRLGRVAIHIVHDISDLDGDPAASGIGAVVYGHSHKPAVRNKDGVLYVNPGSAGPRRFALPISVGRLTIDAGQLSATLITIRPAPR